MNNREWLDTIQKLLEGTEWSIFGYRSDGLYHTPTHQVQFMVLLYLQRNSDQSIHILQDSRYVAANAKVPTDWASMREEITNLIANQVSNPQSEMNTRKGTAIDPTIPHQREASNNYRRTLEEVRQIEEHRTSG